jgi:polysaccharide biosynthesis protein PslG
MTVRQAVAALLLVATALTFGVVLVQSLPGPAAALVPGAAEAAGEEDVVPEFPAVGISVEEHLGERDAEHRTRELDEIAELGVGWVRHDVQWDVVEPERGELHWSAPDAVIEGARSRDLDVLALITYTPAWANGGHSDHRYAPEDPAEFAAFAGAVARRYAQLGVHAYEIWNEPNIAYWQPGPDPAAYVAVLRAAAEAIREADPDAVIVTGGTSPAGDGPDTISPHTWLRALYEEGAKPWFDAIGHHPYVDSDIGPDSTDPGNPWFQMAGSTPSIRSIQADYDDEDKRIWATEVGCRRSLGDCEPRLVRAVELWRTYPWAGMLAWFTFWDPGEYGLVDGDWTRRPIWHALRTAVRASSAPPL